MHPFLQVNNLNFHEAGHQVLYDISFQQEVLQKIAIAGETGSGKSTLMQIIAGFAQPSTGGVYFKGEKVWGPAYKLVPGHEKIAYLSQQFELPQFLRVEQVLHYANKLSEAEAKELYEVCEITHLFKRRTDHASGGERQRIALARLLSGRPELLLLDEPFSNLDMQHKNTLRSVIDNIGSHLKITCMLISHDPLDTLSWADKILVMQGGRIILSDDPEKIYNAPPDEYVAGLFGKYNVLEPELVATFGLKSERTIVRPENFHIAESGLKARVLRVNYFGSYYILEVEIGGKTIQMRSLTGDFKVGDAVEVGLVR